MCIFRGLHIYLFILRQVLRYPTLTLNSLSEDDLEFPTLLSDYRSVSHHSQLWCWDPARASCICESTVLMEPYPRPLCGRWSYLEVTLGLPFKASFGNPTRYPLLGTSPGWKPFGMQVWLPPRADCSATESPGLSVTYHATPAMQEHWHHGSCLTIAFSGHPRLRSVLGTTPRKAAAQDCDWSCTCCTHNGTSSTNWTHRGRAMEISSGASPSSQLGQQLPNLYKKETCISL